MCTCCRVYEISDDFDNVLNLQSKYFLKSGANKQAQFKEHECEENLRQARLYFPAV